MLHQLSRPASYKTKGIQIGRWNGSGKGNYSTKGLKGQTSRTWFSQKPWFEWGQTPLHMRLPKRRWFKRHFKLINHTVAINLNDLENNTEIENGSTVSLETLFELGFGKRLHTVKILGNGALTKALHIQGVVCSQTAKTAIETAGGSVQ